jgi:hypothetical protein
MYFTESAYLLNEGVAGKSVIERVDAFLGARDRSDVFDADLVARHVDHPLHDVGQVLAALSQRAVLSQQRMVRCEDPACRTLTPASRVEEARTNGDQEPCDGPCGQNLAAEGGEVVIAYAVVSRPVA